MSFRTVTVICAALCFTLVAGDYKLPATVKTCKKDADDFSSCLRLALQESWPTFVQGIPELDLPVLDPFYTEYQENTYENGEMRGKITGTDVRTYGLSKTHFLSVKPELDGDSFRLIIDMDLPKMLIDGNYKAEGSLGSFKIGGKGFFNISMENLRTRWDIQGQVVNDRWNIEHFKITPEVGSMKVWFSDLFNGNEDFNRAAMSFINEYWPIVYRGMLPYLTETWDKDFTKFANTFFSKIPFSTLFP